MDYFLYEQKFYVSGETDDILRLEDTLNKLKEIRKIDDGAYLYAEEGLCIYYKERRTEEEILNLIEDSIKNIFDRINTKLKEVGEEARPVPTLPSSIEDSLTLFKACVSEEREVNNFVSNIKRRYYDAKKEIEDKMKEKYWGEKPTIISSWTWPLMSSGCQTTAQYINKLNERDYNITL